jgi:hypothetical protein
MMLYLKAMCNPMPNKFVGLREGTYLKLENVFGYVEAKMTTPENLEIPLES